MGDLDEQKKNKENRWLYNCAKKTFLQNLGHFFQFFLTLFFMLHATELKSAIKKC